MDATALKLYQKQPKQKRVQRVKLILTNNHISIHRRRALDCYIEPFLMYGYKAWSISKHLQKKFEATENNVVSSENAMKLMNCKEIKWNEKQTLQIIQK